MGVQFIDTQDDGNSTDGPDTRHRSTRVRRVWLPAAGLALVVALAVVVAGGHASAPIVAPSPSSTSSPAAPVPPPFALDVASGVGIVCAIQPGHSCDSTGLPPSVGDALQADFGGTVTGDVVADLPFSRTLGYSALITLDAGTVLLVVRRAAGAGDPPSIGPLTPRSRTREGWQLLAATVSTRPTVLAAVSRWLATGPLPD